jgi:hypothetical protein
MKRNNTTSVQRGLQGQKRAEQLGLLSRVRGGGLGSGGGEALVLADALASTLDWARAEVARRCVGGREGEGSEGVVLALDSLGDRGLIEEARTAFVAELAAVRMAEIAQRRIDAVRQRARDLALERDPGLPVDDDYAFDPEGMRVLRVEGSAGERTPSGAAEAPRDTRALAVGQYRELVAAVLTDLRMAHTFSVDERIRARAPALHDLARAVSSEGGEDGAFGAQHRVIVEGWLGDPGAAAVFAASPPEGAPAHLVRIAGVLGEGGPSDMDGEDVN